MYKLPMTVGPFIVNMRQAFDEVSKLLEETHMLLGEKWSYDPHGVISKRRTENGYSTFNHEGRPEQEKMENLGEVSSVKTSIQTPIITEKTNKRSKDTVVDLDDEEPRGEKRTKFVEDHSSNSLGFTLHLNEEKNAPSSPRGQEISQEQVPSIKQVFSQIEEINQKIKASMETQAEHHIATSQTRLLTMMDLEKDQFRMALSHPT